MYQKIWKFVWLIFCVYQIDCFDGRSLYEPSLDDPIYDLGQLLPHDGNEEMLTENLLNDPMYKFQEESAKRRDKVGMSPEGLYFNYDNGIGAFPDTSTTEPTGNPDDRDEEETEDDNDDEYGDDDGDDDDDGNDKKKKSKRKLAKLLLLKGLKKIREDHAAKRGGFEDRNKMLDVYGGKANAVDLKLDGDATRHMFNYHQLTDTHGPVTRQEFEDRALDIVQRGNRNMMQKAEDIKTLMMDRDDTNEMNTRISQIEASPLSATSQGYEQIGPSLNLDVQSLDANRGFQQSDMWHQNIYPLLQDHISGYPIVSRMGMKGQSDGKELDNLPFTASEFSTPFENVPSNPDSLFDAYGHHVPLNPPLIQDVEQASINENKEKMEKEEEDKKKNEKLEEKEKKEMAERMEKQSKVEKKLKNVNVESEKKVILGNETMSDITTTSKNTMSDNTTTSKNTMSRNTTTSKNTSLILPKQSRKISNIVSNNNTTKASSNTSNSHIDAILDKLSKHIDNDYHREELKLLKKLTKEKNNNITVQKIVQNTTEFLEKIENNSTNQNQTFPSTNTSLGKSKAKNMNKKSKDSTQSAVLRQKLQNKSVFKNRTSEYKFIAKSTPVLFMLATKRKLNNPHNLKNVQKYFEVVKAMSKPKKKTEPQRPTVSLYPNILAKHRPFIEKNLFSYLMYKQRKNGTGQYKHTIVSTKRNTKNKQPITHLNYSAQSFLL